MIIRMQHHARVRKKSKYNVLTCLLHCQITQPRNYFSVTKMNSIEGTDGYNSVSALLKFVCGVICFHDEIVYHKERKISA